MLPLFDLMMKAQNGNAMEAMSKQFGLAQEQMMQAMQALVPAFSTGLKRTATNPYDFSALMAAAASGNYAQYFEDMSKAFSPQGVADGNSILGQIFGSKEVSRAVAAQAAQMSGIGQDILKQMMPILANAMVGGFFKQVAGQFQAAGDAMTKGSTPNMFEQWMQATGMAGQSKPASPSPFDNPFLQSMQAAFSPKAEPTSQGAANSAFGSNPFLDMFQAMLKAGTTAEAPKAPPAEPRAETNPVADMLGQMFESGVEVQKSYQKSMDGIFDSYLASLKTDKPGKA
jgi:hypothetical protein